MDRIQHSQFRLLLGLPLLLATACIGGGGATVNTGPGSGKSSLYLEDSQWGRLVDLLDISGVLVEEDVLIRETLQSDGLDFLLQLNPITGRETLTILHPVDSGSFATARSSATTGLGSLQAKAFDDPPPFTKVARNGAIQLVFSEYLSAFTVDRQTIQVLVAGPNNQFQSLEVRYVVKHGTGADGKPRGIVIIDPTISQSDSNDLNVPANGIGLPASTDQILANLKILIPTKVNPFINQTLILTNEQGSRTIDVKRSSDGNTILEPFEYSGLDPVVVRALRSGNAADTFNGFMTDNSRPSLIVTQDVTVANVTSVSTNVRQITYSIDALRCRDLAPKIGDVFELSNSILQVAQVISSLNSAAYVVNATLLDGTLTSGSGLGGNLTTRYSSQDFNLQLCYVTFAPEPSELPAVGVDPFSTLTIRFSEPADASTVRSLDSMVLASVDLGADEDDLARPWNADGGGESASDYIDRQLGYENIATVAGSNGSGRIRFGPVQVSGDAQSYTLAPLAGLTDSHGEGGSLFYNLALRDGPNGILDLAGNPMDFDTFVAGNSYQNEQISLSSAPSTSRYFALRLNGSDEDNDQSSEYSGQFGPFVGDGRMRPRTLAHFSRPVDPSNPWVGQRLRFAQGIMTPLTPAGAVLMTCWPYHVMGFGLGNIDEYNLDVEGMSWSPFDGVVFDDTFERYSIALAHSNRLPDDMIDGGSGYPKWINSGLRRLSSDNFDNNIFGFGYVPDPQDEVTVFDTEYRISDSTKYLNAGSNFMLPWPDFNQTYTYRDTDLPKPDGVNLMGGAQTGNAYGCPPETLGQPVVYVTGKIPSIGLPLLMRYRCYPRGQEFGFNGFQIQIMVGSSALPAFRVFSAGGRDGQGVWHLIRPDNPPEGTAPSGGYNTTTGVVTKGYGPELYWGQLDFVTRVSRVYSHWFGFGGSLASMTPLTVEPTPSTQVSGTQVIVEMRGSDSITLTTCDDPVVRMTDFDAYGDYFGTCASVTTPTIWSTNVQGLITGGLDFFQVRVTFISNIQQDLDPVLDALGFAWNVQ
jgi:hypothetical protein